MQSNAPAAPPASDTAADSDLNSANERLSAAQSNLDALQSDGAATLKQKMLIRKAEDHLAEMRKTQEVSAYGRT